MAHGAQRPPKIKNVFQSTRAAAISEGLSHVPDLSTRENDPRMAETIGIQYLLEGLASLHQHRER